MTPEQHYARGLELLDLAERSTEVGPLHANAVLAQTHFSAAASGTGIQAIREMVAGERARVAAAEDNARAAAAESVVACSELPSCRDGEHSASCEVAIAAEAQFLAVAIDRLAAQNDTRRTP